MEKTEELKTEMAELKDNAIEVIEEGKTIATRVIEEQDEKLAQMLDKSFLGQKRILQAFPNMKSKNYNEELKVLKKKIFKINYNI